MSTLPVFTADPKLAPYLDVVNYGRNKGYAGPANQQAARVSQKTAFVHLGQLVEYGDTSVMVTNPRETRTTDYITGRYG